METAQLKRAVIYCRVSTKEQVEEGNSLATQEKNCKEYAYKHGYETIATYIEQGESAKTADRTELKKLIAFCTSKKSTVDAVIVYKIDRLSRNTYDYSQIKILLKKYAVQIKSTTENFDDNPAGRFMENIIANVAQFDNDVRAERCMGGMRDAMREGRYVWMAPYGYSNVRVNGKATIAFNESADLVRKAFEAVARGQFPVTEIRKQLIAAGMCNASGKPLSQSYFYTMLKNELYTGWINKFGERHKGLFEPIISQELFYKVQQVLSGKRHIYPQYEKENKDFPLRKFFRHPSGIAMTGCWSQGRKKKYPYYLIHRHNINIRKEILEETFKGWLNQFKMDIDYFEKLDARVKEHTKVGISYSTEQREVDKKKIEALKAKQALILDKNIEGVISNELCKEQMTKIDIEIYELQQHLQTLSEPAQNMNSLLDATRAVLLNPGEVWANADFEEKIKLQWFYFPDGIEIDKTESRTSKICKLFKGKSEIPAYFSSNVHFKNSKSNTPNWQTLKIIKQNAPATNETLSLPDLYTELQRLSEIITSHEKSLDHLVLEDSFAQAA